MNGISRTAGKRAKSSTIESMQKIMSSRIGQLLIKYREVITYLLIGGLTTVVYFAVYAVFKSTGTHYGANTCISWIISVMFAFFANKYIVFRSMKAVYIMREMLEFFGARLTTLGIDLGVTFFMIDIVASGEWPAKIVSQCAVIILNYVFSKVFVFRKRNT